MKQLEQSIEDAKAQYSALRVSETTKIEDWEEKSRIEMGKFKTTRAENQCFLREEVLKVDAGDLTTSTPEEKYAGTAEEFRKICSTEPCFNGMELPQAEALFNVMMKFIVIKELQHPGS